MGIAAPAGFPGYAGNWAEDHVEDDGRIGRLQRALEGPEDPETTDDDWFEDDLLSLIQNRPSRQLRRAQVN